MLSFLSGKCRFCSFSNQEYVLKRIALVALVAALSACSTDTITAPTKSLPIPTAVSNGFDVYGYNDVANIFNGIADGVDKVLGNGDMGIYGQDHLVMGWNRTWENCNAARRAGATQEQLATLCAGAWTFNNWNGQVPGGSGDVWQYKIQYYGQCGANGTLLPDGGYCIWGEYEVIFSQGTSGNQHFWDAHAKPVGFGV
jgi:hypothetical protein